MSSAFECRFTIRICLLYVMSLELWFSKLAEFWISICQKFELTLCGLCAGNQIFPGGSTRAWAGTKLCYLIWRPINGSSDEMSWPYCEYGTRFYVTVRQMNNYHHNDSLLVSSIFSMKDLELIRNIRNCHDIQEEITQCVLFILIIS